MTHNNIFKWFKRYFPQYSERVIAWFPNGKDSIRVRQKNGQEFIFTYHATDDWSFETVDSFIKRLRGGK